MRQFSRHRTPVRDGQAIRRALLVIAIGVTAVFAFSISGAAGASTTAGAALTPQVHAPSAVDSTATAVPESGAAGSSCPAGPYGRSDGLCGPPPVYEPHCYITSTVASTYYEWIPIVLLNSPYLGSAYANFSTGSSSTLQVGFSFTVDDAGSVSDTLSLTTTQVNGVQISASNGQSVGYFGLEEFQVRTTSTELSSGAPDACKYSEVPVAVGDLVNEAIPIQSGGVISDINTPTTISAPNPSTGVTYSSVPFDLNFVGPNAPTEASCEGAASLTTTVTTSKVYSDQISLTAGSAGSISTTLSLSYTTSSTTGFTYKFQGGTAGIWYVDDLDGAGSGESFLWSSCTAPIVTVDGSTGPITVPNDSTLSISLSRGTDGGGFVCALAGQASPSGAVAFGPGEFSSTGTGTCSTVVYISPGTQTVYIGAQDLTTYAWSNWVEVTF